MLLQVTVERELPHPIDSLWNTGARAFRKSLRGLDVRNARFDRSRRSLFGPPKGRVQKGPVVSDHLLTPILIHAIS